MAGKSLIQLMANADFSDEEIFSELFMFIAVVKYLIINDQQSCHSYYKLLIFVPFNGLQSNEGLPTTLKALLFHLALNSKIQVGLHILLLRDFLLFFIKNLFICIFLNLIIFFCRKNVKQKLTRCLRNYMPTPMLKCLLNY